MRKVWSPIGERPIAVVLHRNEWLYVYGFVEPKTGKTYWYLIARVNTKWLNLVLKTFAAEARASPQKILLRCYVLQEMIDEIKNLIYYHWFNYS
jgi:hypothetical protein